MKSSADEVVVAEWMLAKLRERDVLYQHAAAAGIRAEFGDQHLYRNKRGSWAINPGVLAAFLGLTKDDVVWSRSSQMWRARKESDPAGKRMIR